MEKIDISQSVKTLEFGSKYEARIQRIFREFDIKTIRDLCQWPGKDLVRVRDMGRKSIEEIEDVLERYNLRLGMLGKELDEYAGIENSVQDEVGTTQVRDRQGGIHTSPSGGKFRRI